LQALSVAEVADLQLAELAEPVAEEVEDSRPVVAVPVVADPLAPAE
jgi:hypothetical protein